MHNRTARRRNTTMNSVRWIISTAPEIFLLLSVAIGTILGRYNQIIAQLRDDPGRYQPLIRQNEHGQVIARDWVAGFMNGVALRADRWQALWKSKEYRNYFAPIAVHLTDAQGNSTTFTYAAQPQGGFTFYNLTKINKKY